MKLDCFEFLKSGCILSVQAGSDQLQVGWGTPVRSSFPYKTGLARGEEAGVSIYAPDFFLTDPQPWWNFPCSTQMTRTELLEQMRLSVSRSCFHLPKGERPSFESFREVFHELQGLFRDRTLKKAVPLVFEKYALSLDADQLASILENLLLKTNGMPLHLYGLWSDHAGILGASPELLFRRESDKVIRTEAIAGTRLRREMEVSSERLPLLDDPKELEEHHLVVEGICGSLKALNLGSLEVAATRELHLPKLIHLQTPITLFLDTKDSVPDSSRWFASIVTSLHPTPALGAFPKEAGIRWLRSASGDRLRFGAPFGTTELCVVSIRNIQWTPSALVIGAGCGVIEASVLEREWDELMGKLDSIKSLLSLEAL